MADARGIVRALGGRWLGGYGVCRCPAHEDRTPSLSVRDAPDGRLLLHCFAGCDFEVILDALKRIGAVSGARPQVSRGPARDHSRRDLADRERQRRERRALGIWDASVPARGSIVEAYLASRGLGMPDGKALRFNPLARHPGGDRGPAMVAKVAGGDGFAVHLTWIRRDGSGKAGVDPQKAIYGLARGGAVQLVDDPARPDLLVAEGIETALAAHALLRPDNRNRCRAWAALSTSGMRSLHLPERPCRLWIAADGDRPGQEAARSLGARAAGKGFEAMILPAPQGRDWADILTGMRKDRIT